MSVKAGDAATLDVLEALPGGSLVVAPDGTIAQRAGGAIWLLPGDERLFTSEAIAPRALTVMRVGWHTNPGTTTERAT